MGKEITNIIEIGIELVEKDERLWVTSLDLAENFNKRHDNVIRDIEKLDCSKEFLLLNFEEISYSDSYGREQKAYQLTRDGFTILAMGFTGKKAMHWKERYISAFNAMEQAILKQAIEERHKASKKARQANLEWQQLRLEGKVARREETDGLKKFIEYAKSQGSQNADRYYSNITKMTYKALGFIEKSMPKENVRGLIDRIGLMNLAAAELLVVRTIKQEMEKNIHYKEVYQVCKSKLELFADLVGKQLKVA